jgi:hypothetical protein
MRNPVRDADGVLRLRVLGDRLGGQRTTADKQGHGH